MTATTTSGPAPLTVTFDGSTSTALNGTIATWVWSFGDNQTSSANAAPADALVVTPPGKIGSERLDRGPARRRCIGLQPAEEGVGYADEQLIDDSVRRWVSLAKTPRDRHPRRPPP